MLGDVKINSSVISSDNTVNLKLSNKNTLTLTNYRGSKVNTVANVSEIQKMTYIYNDESEIVVKGTATNNYIVNEGDTVTVVAGEGDDFILNVGTNDVSVSGGKGNDEIYNTESAFNATLNGGSGDDYINNVDGSDASIFGGSGNDILIGGSDNDTLWGGTGNDSLYGGDGEDNFIYKSGEGTDKIFDYESCDMLTILKSDGKAGGKFTDSSFENYTLTLTINGGGKVILENVSASDEFNINGKIYTINSGKLK